MTADRIDDGEEARVEVSICKNFTSNAIQDAIDTALQFCGGNGIARDLAVADFYEYNRIFRIVDGAEEVHNHVIAGDEFDDIDMGELDPIAEYDDTL